MSMKKNQTECESNVHFLIILTRNGIKPEKYRYDLEKNGTFFNYLKAAYQGGSKRIGKFLSIFGHRKKKMFLCMLVFLKDIFRTSHKKQLKKKCTFHKNFNFHIFFGRVGNRMMQIDFNLKKNHVN